MKRRNKPNLQASLAGFNTSSRADRTSTTSFINSYLRAFPHMEVDVHAEIDELEDWLIGILSRPRPVKAEPEPKSKKWVPRSLWIPDKPYPGATFKRQATNIAIEMRKQLEREGKRDI